MIEVLRFFKMFGLKLGNLDNNESGLLLGRMFDNLLFESGLVSFVLVSIVWILCWLVVNVSFVFELLVINLLMLGSKFVLFWKS